MRKLIFNTYLHPVMANFKKDISNFHVMWVEKSNGR